MPYAQQVQAVHLAPPSVHDYRDHFRATPCNDGSWGVDQITTWVARNGEDDGDAVGIAVGLTEAEARAAADRLNGVQRKAAA